MPEELIERARRRLGRGRGGDGRGRARAARRRRRGAVTGVAGPDGGTPEKPVGLVYLHAEGPDGGLGRELDFPGDRDVDPRAARPSSRSISCARF